MGGFAGWTQGHRQVGAAYGIALSFVPWRNRAKRVDGSLPNGVLIRVTNAS